VEKEKRHGKEVPCLPDDNEVKGYSDVLVSALKRRKWDSGKTVGLQGQGARGGFASGSQGCKGDGG